MKITRVVKAGSVPEMTTLEDGSPGNASPVDRRDGVRAWWMLTEDETSSQGTKDLVTPSSGTPSADTVDGMKFAEPMAKRGRLFASRIHKRRLVQKNGDCNVKSRNVKKRKRKFMVDIFTTLVDMKWRYHLLLFALAFIVTWTVFGGIWYGIAVTPFDGFHPENETVGSCVDNVYDYNSALLFSIETQTTIGYGFRVIQPHCGFAIFIMMLQSCLGLFIQSLITGIIFSKISRPKGRANTIMFSEKAAICKRDGEYFLTFRVGDMRKSYIISTSIRALLVKNRLTAEGESIPLCQYPLTLETETSKSDCFVFLIWPVTVVHKIDVTSPLWDLSAEKLLTEHFEIIVILEGTVESTGMSTQVRTSYIPPEIRWGERLVPLLTFQLNDGHYEIDYKQFHQTTPMTEMPDCSAREYAVMRKEGLTAGELQTEVDYPISFTAPAVRMKNSHHGPLHALFPRSVDAIKKKRAGKGAGKTKDAGTPSGGKPEGGMQPNRAFQQHHKSSESDALNRMKRATTNHPVELKKTEDTISSIDERLTHDSWL